MQKLGSSYPKVDRYQQVRWKVGGLEEEERCRIECLAKNS
jgi:hypothetical protein